MGRISGVVIKGKNEGRKLGFPTANIALAGEPGARSGVYAGKACFDGREYKAAIFISQNVVEAHILDFKGNLYGKEIMVEIGKKIRDIQNFESKEKLKKQIRKDIFIINNP